MELLCSCAEITASFVESVLILSTMIVASGSKYPTRKIVRFTAFFAALSTLYLMFMNSLSAFSFLTPIGTMLFSIFIVGKIVSDGKVLLRATSCVLALFVIQSIDYILIIGVTFPLGNPRELFYNFLEPGIIRIIYLVIDKVCDILLYLWIKKHLTKLSGIRNRIMAFLLMCITLAYGTMQYLIAMVLHGDFIQLQGTAIISFFVLLCFIFILFFSMIVVTVSEKGKATNQMLANLNQNMEKNYYILNENIISNAQTMHDFHHHLSVVDALAKRGDVGSITEYIHSVLTISVTPAQLSHSGNNVIDAVINAKLSEAKQKQIDVDYEVRVEDLSSFEQADICAILSNQIENAFEACEKVENGRKVQIDIQQQEGFVLFKVANRVPVDPFLNNKNLASTKLEPTVAHGFGLKNIQDIAQKYNGSLKNEYSEGRFISTVLICSRTI